jgi:hypothetical protein
VLLQGSLGHAVLSADVDPIALRAVLASHCGSNFTACDTRASRKKNFS